VGEALAQIAAKGYLLVVVSNQSGVARGLVSESQLREIHRRMDELLAEYGVKIHAYECCTHHPDEDCVCRKPKPYLLQEAAQKYDIDLSQSYMVGDKGSDVECGQRAGVKGSYLVLTGSGQGESVSRSKELWVKSLGEFVYRLKDKS
jgi:histidinol-phosphate phosphatase family protein